jgi:hypothetical protein
MQEALQDKQLENAFITRAAQEALHKYMATRCNALAIKKTKTSWSTRRKAAHSQRAPSFSL